MIVADLRSLARPVSEINLDARNANRHDAASIRAIAASLSRFGQRKPIVVRREGMILEAGEGTLLAARELGWTEIAVVLVDDDANTATGFSIADNRTKELSKFDDERLAELVAELASEEEELLTALELDDLLADVEPGGEATGGGEATSGLGNPVIQYNLVFDTQDQQDRWYRFLRFLKVRHQEEETAAARLDAFLQGNDFGFNPDDEDQT